MVSSHQPGPQQPGLPVVRVLWQDRFQATSPSASHCNRSPWQAWLDAFLSGLVRKPLEAEHRRLTEQARPASAGQRSSPREPPSGEARRHLSRASAFRPVRASHSSITSQVRLFQVWLLEHKHPACSTASPIAPSNVEASPTLRVSTRNFQPLPLQGDHDPPRPVSSQSHHPLRGTIQRGISPAS